MQSTQNQPPSHAQQHQGQLADYDNMLSRLKNTEISPFYIVQSYATPMPHSPMAQDHDVAQLALQELLGDEDYQALCRQLKTTFPGELTVTMKEGRGVYETAILDGTETITLSLADKPEWRDLTARIDKATQKLAGQIRSDRLFSLPRMATYYGLTPWNPENAAEHQSAIHTLEEKRASHLLGLENGINVDGLTGKLNHQQITDVIKQFLPADKTSALDYLASFLSPTPTTLQLRTTPATYLEQLLNCDKAQELGNRLLKVLDWYGSQPNEDTSPNIRTKLLIKAICLETEKSSNENPDSIAGYQWQRSSNWGKSYQTLWNEFETHLLESKHASSVNEAILLARLLQPSLPTDFQVRDIPPDLPYRSSIVWVNFVTGVNLVKAIEPAALSRMTFQQLVNLPIQLTEGATTEQLNQIGLARLLPTLDWAATLGVIAQKHREEYTQDDIDRALSALDKHTNDLNQAISRLDEEPPERLSIAKTTMEKLFGKGAFISDGRKLARKAVSEPINFRTPPRLNEYDFYSFLDVLASGKFDDQKKWLITEGDGTTIGARWIRINEHQTIKPEGVALRKLDSRGFMLPFTKLPDVKALFDKDFKRYLELIRPAYQTLIRSQFAGLPFTDRKALEHGALKIYTLRKETQYEEAQNETAEMILPLRARKGFIVQAAYNDKTSYYEFFPQAGVTRCLVDFDPQLIGGDRKLEKWKFSKNAAVNVTVIRHKTLPLDWEAHSNGSAPKPEATCQAIIEQLGDTFEAPTHAPGNDSVPQTLTSARSLEISRFIATNLLFVDETALRAASYGQTEFEREEARWENSLNIAKMFVPFWSSIEDLASGERNRLAQGVFGIFADLLSFALPAGKFAAGSVKVISTAGKLGIRATLPSFASLTKKLLISTLQTLNPIDGIPSLLRGLATGAFKLGKFSIFKLKGLAGRTGSYDFVQGMSQVTDPGSWKPLAASDQLGSVKGIEDVPVRNTGSTNKPAYHLIDPISTKPYGPRLAATDEFSIGRSRYESAGKADDNLLFEIPENARVREVIEVDGSTTVFIDNVSYQLDNASLRRVDTLDANTKLELKACRPRRGLKDQVHCHSYVTKGARNTPPIGSIDETKGYALWFGDKIYTPSPAKPGQKPRLALNGSVYEGLGETLQRYKGDLKNILKTPHIVSRESVAATMEFQKGIYGRIKVAGAAEEIDDARQVGAIIVDSMDGAKTHIFTQLNANDFYFTEIAKGADIRELLTLKKASQADLAEGTLGGELIVVFSGSLTANIMARIHGIPSVQRAVKAMEDIAVPIGGHAKPADTLKWLKVDTSPGEAVMFDHRTRMIVSQKPDGANTWSRVLDASEDIQQKTAEVFNDLFKKPKVEVPGTPQAGRYAFNIETRMQELQKLVRKGGGRMSSPRNIAYAEVHTTAGQREIYVSVSGAQNDTGSLPLFANAESAGSVKVADTTYFNIDEGNRTPPTSLKQTPEGKLLAVPHTVENPRWYSADLTKRPTSLDTESKLIDVIRQKYTDLEGIKSVNIATTLPPCDSCSVVMKQFGYDGASDALNVVWGDRARAPKRKLDASSS